MTHSFPVCQLGLVFVGSALKWFRSYFQDRFQSVKISSGVSNMFKLKFGVPQGSVLGPLLFSLYTTPLSQVIRKYTGVKYHFYADDTQLFIHLSPQDSLKSLDRLKSCLNDIQVWMSENKLKLNPDKTEFIAFGAKDRYKWLSHSFLVNILSNSFSLGVNVLFDAKNFFTNHVNSVIKSCYISLRDLYLIRRFLSVDTSVVIAMLWSAVVWIIAIPYCIVCHPVMLPGSNTFKMLLHSLSPVHL